MTRIQLILEILQVTGIAYPIGPIEKPVAFLMPHGPLDSVQVRNLMRSIPEHELCTQAEFNIDVVLSEWVVYEIFSISH